MTDLYLRSVELTNFRIYGDSYGFEFPGGPGVILITGANGLGKTSFFDGVEWALTNQVSRLEDIQIDGRRNRQDPLTRIGANPDSHRVSLQFSDGAPIDRGLGFEPNEAAIAALLKRPDWAPISNLHGYLSITHFLGQAATRRFSLRKPKEQWEALKGPAGVDRINALRERMSGQGSRQAFTRAIRERTDTLKSASDALLDWNTLIADRDRSQHLASADQAMSPQEVAAELDALAIRVLLLSPTATWTPVAGRDDTESSLHRLASLIDGVDALGRDETGRLEPLAQLVVDFDLAHSETAALTKLLQETVERQAATAQRIAPAESAVANAATAIAVLEREAAQEQHRSVVLSRVAAAARQIDESQRLEKETREQLDGCEATIAAVTTRLDESRIAFDNANAQLARRRALNDNLTLARKRMQISASLAELTSEIWRLSAIGEQKDIAALRHQRTQSVIEAQSAADNIAKLSAELREFDERLQAMSHAISTIAHRIRQDDTHCPICATEFSPGHLAALARSQADDDSTSASDLASSLVTAQLWVEQLNGRAAHLDREIAEHDQLLATLGALRARAASANQQLVEAGGNAKTLYDGSEVATLELELGVLDAALLNDPNVGHIKTQCDEAEAQLRAERAKQVSIERARTRASEAIETARSTLLQYPDFWAQTGGLLVDIATETVASAGRSTDTGLRLANAEAALRECRVELDRLREAEATDTAGRESIDRRMNALVVQRQALTAKWTAGGLSGEPDAFRITQQRARITERSSKIAVVREAQERLTAGYKKWLSDNHLRDMENRIAANLKAEGCGSEADVVECLTRNVDSAQDALATAQRARDRMFAVGEQMTERAETFAGEVLEPLNATIKRFARTLMTRTDESITYRAEHHATSSSLRPGIVRLAPDGSTTQLEMNPNLYFSEGQLSALSVAALLAASTTFGWSRWRGLLMDDPLQHNDVIHASAFMDLLRQMVRRLGYQVILSTHDSAEAEFLVRKCSSAGIPYHVHELAPRGDDGLISVAAA